MFHVKHLFIRCLNKGFLFVRRSNNIPVLTLPWQHTTLSLHDCPSTPARALPPSSVLSSFFPSRSCAGVGGRSTTGRRALTCFPLPSPPASAAHVPLTASLSSLRFATGKAPRATEMHLQSLLLTSWYNNATSTLFRVHASLKIHKHN